MVRFAVPVFCRVTVFAALVDPTLWFPKLKAVGVMLICAATGVTPIPESETAVGDDGAVLVTFRETVCEPTVAGLKLTMTRAVCPGVSTAGSVVADARRYAGELEVIVLMVRFAVPVFSIATRRSSDLDPTLWFPKLKAVGVMLICRVGAATPNS